MSRPERDPATSWRGIFAVYLLLVRTAWSLGRAGSSEVGASAYAGVVILVGIPAVVLLVIAVLGYMIVRAVLG